MVTNTAVGSFVVFNLQRTFPSTRVLSKRNLFISRARWPATGSGGISRPYPVAHRMQTMSPSNLKRQRRQLIVCPVGIIEIALPFDGMATTTPVHGAAATDGDYSTRVAGRSRATVGSAD